MQLKEKAESGELDKSDFVDAVLEKVEAIEAQRRELSEKKQCL